MMEELSEEKNVLEGLEYEKLILNDNVHKLSGKLNKLQGQQEGEVSIDDNAVWLVTGLGYLKKEAPDDLIQSSLEDVIIVSKSSLIDFLKNK